MKIKEKLEDLKLPDDIQLVAVSKKKPKELIEEAYIAGQRIFGENYMQEAVEKIKKLQKLSKIQWHYIGPLQSNKTKDAVKYFDLIQSVDRIKIARKLNMHAKDLNKIQKILIQINIGKEPQKSGVELSKLNHLIQYILTCDHLKWLGFMCIPPFHEDSKPYFQKMQEIYAKYQKQYSLSILSMGMSDDYLEAITFGANMVRIGTKIFGIRQ